MINNLKDLKALFKLCRAQGVTDIEMDGLKLKFGDMPQSPQMLDELDPSEPYANFPQGELTQDQLAYYSAGGKPESDPYLNESMT